jgi:predicted PurR-regulated permease PerM
MNSTGNTAKWAHYAIILTAILMALYFLGAIILPFLLALYLTVLLLPIANLFDKLWFPNWLSALIAVSVLTGIFGGIGFFLFNEITIMAKELPSMISSENQAVEQIQKFIKSPELAAKINDYSQDIIDFGVSNLQNSLTYLSSTVFTIAMIPVYILFMLLSRFRVNAFLDTRYGEKNDHAYKVLQDLKKSIRKYLLGLTTVMMVVSTLLATGLYFLGIPYWLVLGVICGLLGLFPYIGVAIGALLPLTIALLTKDSLFYPLAVLGLFVVVQFLEGNVITPNIIGNAVNLNPVVLMFALLLMGSISGILGLILTIPSLAVARILMDSSEELRPYAKLLANDD